MQRDFDSGGRNTTPFEISMALRHKGRMIVGKVPNRWMASKRLRWGFTGEYSRIHRGNLPDVRIMRICASKVERKGGERRIRTSSYEWARTCYRITVVDVLDVCIPVTRLVHEKVACVHKVLSNFQIGRVH